MFNTRIRFLLILLFFGLGLFFSFREGFNASWYFYVAALLLFITHFVFGSVWAAFSQLRKGKILEAEVLINQIKKPQWLARQNRTYYHFIKGMIALQHKELPEGEKHLNLALDRGLKTNNDNAMAALNLAHICFVEKRPEDAKSYIEKAKSYNPDDLLIKEKLKEMDKVLG